MASRHPSPSRTAWRRSCGERLQSNDSVTRVAPGPSGRAGTPTGTGPAADGFLLFRRSCHPRRLPRQPAAGLVPDHLVAHLVVAELSVVHVHHETRPRLATARPPGRFAHHARAVDQRVVCGVGEQPEQLFRGCLDAPGDPAPIRLPSSCPSCCPQYPCACRRCGRRAIIGHRCPRCCGGVRVAAKTMASSDLGGPRPGGMTVPDRPAGICPDRLPHIAGAGRWPPPDPACVIRCGLLPVPGPERVEARRSGDPILRWPRRRGADAAGRCMTGQWRAGPGSHRKRSARAVSALPGSSGPGPARSARSGAR